MRRLPQSTAYRITFKAFVASDHTTAATGKTIAVTLSKNGGAFGNPSAGATNATEIANGWYYVDLSTTDTNTLGDLIVRATESTIDSAEQIAQVVSATTGGLTALPNVAAGANGGLPLGDASGRVTVGSIANGAIAAATFAANALDAVWSTATRLLTAGTNIVLAKGTGVTGFNDLDAAGVRTAVGLASANLDTQLSGINSKTTNLPSDPADASDVAAAFTALQSHGDSAWATATGFATPGDVPSAADNASAVLDVAIASHLGSGSVGDAIYQAAVHAINVDGQVGPAGAGLTALGDARLGHLDADISSITVPSAADVADAVWDEAVADHAGTGSTGAALAAAGGSGDPWATSLPGAYSAGTAGKIIGDALDAAVSSRLATTDYTAPPSTADIATAVATQTLSANVVEVNSITVSGSGTAGDPWGPA